MPSAGRLLSAAQAHALAQTLKKHEEMLENIDNKEYNDSMEELLCELVEIGFPEPSGGKPWRKRLDTLYDWIAVIDDVASEDSYVLQDRQTRTTILSEDRWSDIVERAIDLAWTDEQMTVQELIQAVSDELQMTYSTNGKRFGITNKFIAGAVAKRMGESLKTAAGTRADQIHFFLNLLDVAADTSTTITPELILWSGIVCNCHQFVAYWLERLTNIDSRILCDIDSTQLLLAHSGDGDGKLSVDMVADELVPTNHFGDGITTYSAVVVGFADAAVISYRYRLKVEAAIVAHIEDDLDKAQGVRRERAIRASGRNQYVLDQFGESSKATYERHRRTAGLLRPLWDAKHARKRREGNAAIACLMRRGDGIGDGQQLTSNTAPIVAHYWELDDTSEKLAILLQELKSIVAPRPQVSVNKKTISLRYHCHRGPAWRLDANRKSWLVQHVPQGSAPQQEKIECNVGCNWNLLLQYPENFVPNCCPLTGAILSGAWRDKVKFQSIPDTDLQSKTVECRVINDHYGHCPGTSIDAAFLPCHPEMIEFGKNLLTWGMTPYDVLAVINEKVAIGEFEDKSHTHRLRPLLREVQEWSHNVKKQDWCCSDSWEDMMQKVNALHASGDIVFDHHQYDPGNQDPSLRGFKLFLQHRTQQKWIAAGGFQFRVIFIDATHNTNQYGMQLVTGAAEFPVTNLQTNKQTDKLPRNVTIPLWYMLYTLADSDLAEADRRHHNQRALNFMMEAVYKRNPKLNCGRYLADKDETEHHAITTSIVGRALVGAQELKTQLSTALLDDSGLCSPPSFQGAITSEFGLGTDCNDYISAIYQMNALEWNQTGGFADITLPFPVSQYENEEVVLPHPPSPKEYTNVLIDDISELIAHLQRCQEMCQSFGNQRSAWLRFQDTAADFILRHYPVHQLSSEGDSMPSSIVYNFVERFLFVTKMLCEFHVKKAWNEALARHVKDEKVRDAIYFDLQNIMFQANTRQKAADMIHAFSEKWKGQANALRYCQEHWFCEYWLSAWAAFGRRFDTNYQRTTLPLEGLHGTLKHTIMGGVVNRRPGSLLDALFGAPGNERLLSKSAIAYYGGRLQDAQDGRHRGRLRAVPKRVRSRLTSLQATFEQDKQTCQQALDKPNTWYVYDGQRYTVRPITRHATVSMRATTSTVHTFYWSWTSEAESTRLFMLVSTTPLSLIRLPPHKKIPI
eukprot:scaffold147803_cov18-Prasinocladus_malaysianus.AAC.2